MNKKLSTEEKKAMIQFWNLKLLHITQNGCSKVILGSYLNRGNANRILKIYNKDIWINITD